ncbi:MAG: hypothetical protein ABW321_07130 [Polyangiales bacterium]
MARTRGADLLILAAHAPELVGLRAALGADLAGSVSNVRVVCATVGVGLPAAAAGTQHQLRETRARAVVLLGSCGLYPRRTEFRPLQVVVPDAVQLVDAGVVNGKAAFPGPMQHVLTPSTTLSEGLAAQDPAVLRSGVATTLGITTDDAHARKLGRKTGCGAENLEAFAVALACEAHALPFASVLVATNAVGSQGRAQWREHQRKAAERGARLLLRWLKRGATGL